MMCLWCHCCCLLSILWP